MSDFDLDNDFAHRPMAAQKVRDEREP